MTALSDLKLSADICPRLDELSYGYDVLCYEDGEYQHTWISATKDGAEDLKDRWLSGDSCLRHRAMLGRGFSLVGPPDGE